MERFKNVLDPSEVVRVDSLLLHIDETCRRHNIDYVLDGGSLIGSMLHHDRIPWDDDFDIYIRSQDRPRATRVLHKNGFVVSSNGHYSKLWTNYFPRVANNRPWNWPFVDIGWLNQNETHMWEHRVAEQKYKHHIYRKEWLFPSVRRPFGNLVMSAPRDAESLLNHRFGKKWSRVCVLNHWDHKLEKWRYERYPNENTYVPCNHLDVNIVQRVYLSNGISMEWLVNPFHDDFRGATLTFHHGSLS